MPPGEITDPKTKEGFLKSGYLKRYDLYEDDETPYKMPVVGSHNLKKGDPILFDVIQATLSSNGNTYIIPVAFVREESDYDKTEWDNEWDKANMKAETIKDENLKTKLKEKIKGHKIKYPSSKS